MSSLVRIGSGTGNGSKIGTEAVIDGQRGSQRTSISPLDYTDMGGNVYGFYSAVLRTGSLAATMAANSPLVSFRWTSTTTVALILAIRWAHQHVTATATAVTGFPDAEAIIARSFSVADTGGTATVPSKMRSTMANSAVGDFRVATTAQLSAGTRTLDSVGFAFASAPVKVSPDIGATAATGIAAGVGTAMQDVYKWDRLGGHPPVLQANEGLILRQSSAGPAAGTYQFIFALERAELAGF